MTNKTYLYPIIALSLLISIASAQPTLPSGINYYANVVLTNSQSSATTGNFQQMVSFNALAVCNALICAPHLNNTEFFFPNGSIINSWYESANGLANNYGSNSFSVSTNVIAWVLLPPANYITASGSNIIYLGFASNTVNFFSTAVTGEAPQLTCPNANLIICGGTYANYDNGNSVFNFYDNFKGPLNSEWTNYGVTDTVDNGFTATQSTNGLPYVGCITGSCPAINYASNVMDLFGTVFYGSGGYNVCSGMAQGTATGQGTPIGELICGGYPSGSETTGFIRRTTGSTYTSTPPMQLSPANVVWTIIPTNAISVNYYLNYNGKQTLTTGADAPAFPLYPNLVDAGAGGGAYTFSNPPLFVQWYRIRSYPPNSVMPSVTVGNVMASTTALTFNSLTTTPTFPATFDVGQSLTFNAYVYNGVGAYTYNFIVSNAVTGAVVYSNSVSNALTNNALSFTIPQYFTTNSPLKANVVVTDTEPVTVNSVYTANFMVSNQLFSTSWTASNAVLDYNQFQVLNGIISGGTSGFTYNILVYNAIGTLVFNSLSPYTYATSNVNVFLQQTVWGYGNFIANVFITDSAYSPVTASNTLTYVVESTSTTSTTTTTSSISTTTTIIPGATSCRANVFTLTPVISGNVFTNVDTGNTMTFYVTAAGNTSVYLNGTLVETIPTAGTGGGFLLPKGWTANLIFANPPSVVVQCTPETSTTILLNYDTYGYLAVGLGVGITMGIVSEKKRPKKR